MFGHSKKKTRLSTRASRPSLRFGTSHRGLEALGKKDLSKSNTKNAKSKAGK